MSKKKKYALITGASRGLGKAFAKELATRKHNLILVSLPNEGLAALADTIEQSKGVRVEHRETDLTVKKNILRLAKEINNDYRIDILINNAGFGGGRYFSEVSESFLNRMILLNVRATVLLTHQLLPNLSNGERSYVLNVSSMAAMCPIPYKTVYPPTKAFIYNFSRSMEKEFSSSNISFAVVNPGPMMTNPDVIKRMEYQGFIVRQSILTPEKVARISIKKLLNGKHVITLTNYHRLQWFLLRIIPERIKMRILGRIAKNEVLTNEQYANIGYRS